MITSFFLSLLILAPTAQAALPRAAFILQKTVENHGQGVYQIEQEVTLTSSKDASEPIVLKETWLVENENSLRLIVSGTKELKSEISMGFSYGNGLRVANGKTQNISTDFYERYFHYRSTENFKSLLSQLHLIPDDGLARPTIKDKKVIYPEENFVRLSRTGGVIDYAFGSADGPGLWIEQDQFVIRKIKLPSGAEVSADQYSTYGKNFNFPRLRTLRWGQNLATFKTIGVSPRAKNSFPALPTRTTQTLPSIVEEFYSRFR